MNLAKEMKKKRDAEKRLEQNSPTTIFVEGGGGEKSYNDYSKFATKKQLEEKAAIEHAHNFIDLVDSPISYVGQAGKVAKVNATENGLEFGEGGKLVQATETVLGGIKAKAKTTESSEIAIDTLTGKLYAPSSGSGGGTNAESILTKPINIPSFAGKNDYILAYNETNGEFYLKLDSGGGGGNSGFGEWGFYMILIGISIMDIA